MTVLAHMPWSLEVGDHTHRFVLIKDADDRTVHYKYGSGTAKEAAIDVANARLIAAYCAVTAPFKYAFLAYNRHCRTKNIAAHGWPTAPIDADGDVVWPKPEVEQ